MSLLRSSLSGYLGASEKCRISAPELLNLSLHHWQSPQDAHWSLRSIVKKGTRALKGIQGSSKPQPHVGILGSVKKSWCLEPSPWDSDLCSLDTWNLKSSPDDSKVQSRQRATLGMLCVLRNSWGFFLPDSWTASGIEGLKIFKRFLHMWVIIWFFHYLELMVVISAVEQWL